jgi:hypothetical protein
MSWLNHSYETCWRSLVCNGNFVVFHYVLPSSQKATCPIRTQPSSNKKSLEVFKVISAPWARSAMSWWCENWWILGGKFVIKCTSERMKRDNVPVEMLPCYNIGFFGMEFWKRNGILKAKWNNSMWFYFGNLVCTVVFVVLLFLFIQITEWPFSLQFPLLN